MKNSSTPLVTLNGEALYGPSGRVRVSDGRWLIQVRNGAAPWPSRIETATRPVVRYNVEQLRIIEAALEDVLIDYGQEQA